MEAGAKAFGFWVTIHGLIPATATKDPRSEHPVDSSAGTRVDPAAAATAIPTSGKRRSILFQKRCRQAALSAVQKKTASRFTFLLQ